MRIADFVITAAVVAGLSGPAMAQEGSSQQTAVPQQQTAVPTAPPPAAVHNNYNNNNNDEYGNWVASGFVGTNFGTSFTDNLLDIDTNNSSSSFNFGGQVAYLWGGWVGLEGLAEFAPSFQINDVLFENNPNINTYMANGIVAGHWGDEHQYMPYASAGIGAVQMRSNIFAFDVTGLIPLGTVRETGSRFGWDVGAGVMGFAGKWGFRGDVRYYRASVDNNIDLLDIGTGNVFTQTVLSGLAFWKANAGVAFRW